MKSQKTLAFAGIFKDYIISIPQILYWWQTKINHDRFKLQSFGSVWYSSGWADSEMSTFYLAVVQILWFGSRFPTPFFRFEKFSFLNSTTYIPCSLVRNSAKVEKCKKYDQESSNKHFLPDIGVKSFKYSSCGWQSGKLSANSLLGSIRNPFRFGGFSFRGISW